MTRIRTSLLVAAVAAAATAVPAEAQLRPWEIGIGGGPSFVTGDYANEAGTGYHVQFSVGFGLPLFPVGFRGDLLWQELPAEDEGFFRQVGGMANATLGLPLLLIEPYVLGGIGIVDHSPPEHEGHAHGEEGTATAFNVGAGLEFGLLGLKGFGEVRYLDAGHGARTIPLTVGIRF